jgi:hypothetical protein
LIGMGRNGLWKDNREVLEVGEGAGDKRKGKIEGGAAALLCDGGVTP